MAARAVTRQHEIGIRIAIGAGRWRIFRQLCTESLVLGALGSLAGLGLSWAVLRIVLLKFDAPGWLTARPDWRVLLFAVAMTVVATLFFGVDAGTADRASTATEDLCPADSGGCADCRQFRPADCGGAAGARRAACAVYRSWIRL